MHTKKTTIHSVKTYFVLLTCGLLELFYTPQPGNAQQLQLPFQVGIDMGWQSAYVSEGRDHLDGTNFYVVQPALTYKNWSAEVWYGAGQAGKYQEVNTSLFYSWQKEDVSITPGITRLDYLHNHQSEYEASLAINYEVQPWLEIGSYSVYSDRTEGAFHKISLKGNYQIPDTEFNLRPFVAQAVDWGYASASYNGFNHLEWGLTARYHMNSLWHIQLKAIRIQAQEDMLRHERGNHNWLSLGFSLSIK